MDKKSYRVRNWGKYNEALVKRGSVTFWFNEESIKKWHEKPKGKRGRPKEYSEIAIECGLTLRAVFNLPFRATEGFIRSLVERLKLKIKTPDYTLLCKRQKDLKVEIGVGKIKGNESIHILVDTTGLKVFGEGEWKVKQHGWIKHRLWRKLHVAINGESQEIEGYELTDLGVQDCEGFERLLDGIGKEMGSVKADGSYDRYRCYEKAEKKGVRLITPPQRNARTSKERKHKVKKKASANALKKRDGAIKRIRKVGRKGWKKETGYHRRSLAETAMFRIKTMLGNRLSTRILEHQKVEAGIWCKVINKMTALGMPKSIAVN